MAFTVSYVIGYRVNSMLVWRVFAAQEPAQRLGDVVIPAILVVVSSLAMWFLVPAASVRPRAGPATEGPPDPDAGDRGLQRQRGGTRVRRRGRVPGEPGY